MSGLKTQHLAIDLVFQPVSGMRGDARFGHRSYRWCAVGRPIHLKMEIAGHQLV